MATLVTIKIGSTSWTINLDAIDYMNWSDSMDEGFVAFRHGKGIRFSNPDRDEYEILLNLWNQSNTARCAVYDRVDVERTLPLNFQFGD